MKTAAIVAASEFNENAFREMNDSRLFDYVMAVDAGYDHLLRIGHKCDMVLGDFDSVKEEPRGVRSCKFPADKDDSDFQLAINRMLSLGYEKVYVFGALGKRLDHTLSNLLVASLASKFGLEVIIIGLNETVYFISDGECFEKDSTDFYEGTTISIMKLRGPVKGLFIRGLKWEGDDLNIDEKPSKCLSNLTRTDPILIGIESGTVAIIVNAVLGKKAF